MARVKRIRKARTKKQLLSQKPTSRLILLIIAILAIPAIIFIANNRESLDPRSRAACAGRSVPACTQICIDGCTGQFQAECIAGCPAACENLCSGGAGFVCGNGVCDAPGEDSNNCLQDCGGGGSASCAPPNKSVGERCDQQQCGNNACDGSGPLSCARCGDRTNRAGQFRCMITSNANSVETACGSAGRGGGADAGGESSGGHSGGGAPTGGRHGIRCLLVSPSLTCKDNVQDCGETGVDCGGGCPTSCSTGRGGPIINPGPVVTDDGEPGEPLTQEQIDCSSFDNRIGTYAGSCGDSGYDCASWQKAYILDFGPAKQNNDEWTCRPAFECRIHVSCIDDAFSELL